ncbi:MAG: hypothetical protein ABL997_21075 [Planctomycetota bacterium]
MSDASATAATAKQPQKPQSLRRELLAIAFLYVVLSILPLLIGLFFAA